MRRKSTRVRAAQAGKETAPALAMVITSMVLVAGPAGCAWLRKSPPQVKQTEARQTQTVKGKKVWSPQAMLKKTWDEQSSLDEVRIELLKIRGSRAILELEHLLGMMVGQRRTYDISSLEPLGMRASKIAERIRQQLPKKIIIWKFAEPLEKDVKEVEETCKGIRQGFIRIKKERVKGVEKELEIVQQRLRRRRSRKNMLALSRLRAILSSVQAGTLESYGQSQSLDSAIAEAGKELETQRKDSKSLRDKVKGIMDRLNAEWMASLKALAKERGIHE
jgi:hypothetical protein